MKQRVLAILTAVAVVCGGALAAAQEAGELIQQADAAFDRWTGDFDFAAYQARLEAAIELWEQALPLVPAEDVAVQAHVLNHLAQAHFEMAEAYLFAAKDREAAYAAGSDYALRSLRLNPVFGETEARDRFRAALRSATDVAAIFWYGNNVGQWYNFNWFAAIVEAGVQNVLAAYERAIELDETYLGGAPQRSLAALIAQAYFVLGMSRDDAVPHYERSIEIDPDYLESYYNYAQFYALPTQQTELAASLLRTLDEKAQDPESVGKWPFYNTLAVRRAEPLKR